jgi:hypothetical protein
MNGSPWKAFIESLASLSSSDLTQLLSGLSKPDQAAILSTLIPSSTASDERSTDVTRKRLVRSEAARIVIPEIKNPQRREQCLRDPELFLRTYFASRYHRSFSRLHRVMIETIYDRAKYGGRQAVAAPRGVGKTELAKGMLVYLIFAGLVRFPLVIAATSELAGRIYKDFRSKITNNELLYEDFPEVCHPVRALEGAPQRAGKQHVDGELTRIVWTANDYLSLPYVPGSHYGGVKMSYYGLDSAFRGVNIDGDRPSFVLIDDPETRESASSLDQIATREMMVDQDVAGLGELGDNIAIALLTTVQNRYCYSWRVTDPKIKPAFNGQRFALIEKWPDNMDAWFTYVAKRNTEGEVAATEYYAANREDMDRGHVMLVEDFQEVEKDGKQLVHSALQAAWNKIAETSMAAFRTEYQNDPEEEEAIEGNGLTAAKVQMRLALELQNELPRDTECVTIGLDIGKHSSHWVKVAWQNPAIGTITDYGVMETYGLTFQSEQSAIESALLAALEAWADDMRASNPLLVFIDSGAYSDAVYTACRKLGRPFFPSKGWDAARFRMPQARTNDRIPFPQAFASKQNNEALWLYNLNTEHWKTWCHQRFLIESYDAAGGRNAGSIAIYNHAGDKKRHLSFAHHIVAEELQLIPVHGGAVKPKLVLKSRNNHWLDALAMASAAAACVGIKVLDGRETILPKAKQEPRKTINQFRDPWGRSFVASKRT